MKDVLDFRRIAAGVLVSVLTMLTAVSCSVETTEPVAALHSELLVPTYAQQAYIKASNTNAGDSFSVVAVSADGNTLAVGAPFEDSNGTQSNNALADSGAVYVYTRSGGAWTQQAYLKASNLDAGDGFGSAVVLSGDGNTLAVAAYYEASSSQNVNGPQADNTATRAGAVYTFRRVGGNWSQQAYIKAFNTDAFDHFGNLALSGDGNTLAVGAPLEDSAADGINGNQADNTISMAGAVYVYNWTGAAWAPQAYIKAPNSDFADFFSTLTLSTDGNTLAVGASGEGSNATGVNGNQNDNSVTSAGAVYVYTRLGSTWSFQAYIKASNTALSDNFGIAVSLSGDGNTLAVGAYGEDSNAVLVNGNAGDNSAANAGAVYVYTRSAGNWSLHSYLKAPNTEAGDNFGTVLALSNDGSTLAIAAGSEDSAATGVNGALNDNSASGSGAVYTYGLVGGNWRLNNYVKASNTGASDSFRWIALSSDGGTLVVGADGEDSAATGVGSDQTSNAATDSGAVYVFTSTLVPTFDQQAYVKASNTGAGDAFKVAALSGDGNTLVVGARGEDSAATGINGNQADNTASGSGAAYVFTRAGATWTQQAYLKASNASASDAFGEVVAISADGDTLAVSAPIENSAATGVNGNQSDNSLPQPGAVYVFTRAGGVWTQQAYVKASNTSAFDLFGLSLALSGDGNTLVVGAMYEDSNATGLNGDQSNDLATNSGAAYVFVRSAGVWSQQAYLKSSNSSANDSFGGSLALSSNGDTLAITAGGEDSAATLVNGNQNDDSAPESGAAYIFTRSSGVWTQQAYIKASNTEASDSLSRVALSDDGNVLALGASGEDSNALDVNGTQANNSASDSGAVYVYTRSGGSWSHQAYLKASNTAASDAFGRALALSGDGTILAVTADGEDSVATGVNGNRSDNSASGSGALYTFTRIGGTWSRGDYVKASNTGASDSLGSYKPGLSTDGSTLVVASGYEDSSATGINGTQSDNSASDSGAVYVYTR
jgi:hypothetical protein